MEDLYGEDRQAASGTLEAITGSAKESFRVQKQLKRGGEDAFRDKAGPRD
jgi:hypothetical protein